MAHGRYLADVMSKALISDDSKVSRGGRLEVVCVVVNVQTCPVPMQELQVELKHIGAVVLRFHQSVTQIYEGAVAEAEKRGTVGREAGARTQQGKWGLTERDTVAETSRRTRFLEGIVNPADEELAKLDRAFKVRG